MLDLDVFRKDGMRHESNIRHGVAELHHRPRHVVAAGDQAQAGEGAGGHPGGGLPRVGAGVVGLIAQVHTTGPQAPVTITAQLRALDSLRHPGHEEPAREAAFEQAQPFAQAAGAAGGDDDRIGDEARALAPLARHAREPQQPRRPEQRAAHGERQHGPYRGGRAPGRLRPVRRAAPSAPWG